MVLGGIAGPARVLGAWGIRRPAGGVGVSGCIGELAGSVGAEGSAGV